MINYGANYIGVGRDRYDAGNKFYSQDRFLQGVGLDKPAITFNSSPDNSGIMGMYPKYPYPPIMSEDGGDGGGPFGGIDKGVTADASAAGGYNLNPDETAFNSPEVEEEIAAARNKDRLTQAAQLGLFALNPVGYIMGKAGKAAFGFVKDKFFGGDDGDGGGFDQCQYDAGKASAAAQAAANRDYARSGGDDGGSSGGTSSTAGADTSRSDDSWSSSPFEYGGRVGYSNGGLSKYEIFKLGELGYNTKGGTVTAPFGGIKVLRDILRVNQYAYGGVVGLYR